MNLFRHFNLIPAMALAGALTASVSVAHATTITYALTGVETSAGSVSGTVTIDTTTDLVTAANITFNDATFGSPVFNNTTPNGYNPSAYNGLAQDYISGLSNSSLNYGGQIALYYDTASIGTGNLKICLTSGPCGTGSNQGSYVQVYGYGGLINITSGSLDPVTSTGSTLTGSVSAATPEPSSLALLGTGILGLAGLAIRRRRLV